MIRQRGLVVGGDDADVAAVVLRRAEIKIGQTDEHLGSTDRIAYPTGIGGGIDGDPFADRPILIPPGLRGGGPGETGHQTDQQDLNKG